MSGEEVGQTTSAVTSLASEVLVLAVQRFGAVGDLQKLATDAIIEVAALQAEIKVLTAHNSQSDAICPHFKVEKYLGSDGWIEVNKCIVAGKLTHI